jgi:hypothetical protein
VCSDERREGRGELLADPLAETAQSLDAVHDAGMADEVVRLELALLDPAVRADRAQVERLLHPEFREIGASGRMWDRDEMIAALEEDPGGGATASELETRLVAEGVVLLTYATGDARRSSLWVLGEDGWRVLFHQGTRTTGASTA